jgi:DNA helicase INO80
MPNQKRDAMSISSLLSSSNSQDPPPNGSPNGSVKTISGLYNKQYTQNGDSSDELPDVVEPMTDHEEDGANPVVLSLNDIEPDWNRVRVEADSEAFHNEKLAYINSLKFRINSMTEKAQKLQSEHNDRMHQYALVREVDRQDAHKQMGYLQYHDQVMAMITKEEHDQKKKSTTAKKTEKKKPSKGGASTKGIDAASLQETDELEEHFTPEKANSADSLIAVKAEKGTSSASKAGKENGTPTGKRPARPKRKQPDHTDETDGIPRTRIKLTNGKSKEKDDKKEKGKEDKNEKSTTKEKGSSKEKTSKDKAQSAPKPPSQKELRAVARLYQNTFESIWKEMARRDANKTFKLVQTAVNVRQSNARKTAALAAKEARRWQFRTNKSYKDLQSRARRGMKEMLAFWKRNEREERELRRKAEKEALDQAKKEEEQRESRRQARKLNFLITQTELYSHFVGSKIKGDGDESMPASDPAALNGRMKSTNASDLDFDTIDEDDLKKAAMANAQNAVLDAKRKAASFNSGDGEIKNIDIDSEEMNFQNPTSLGDLQIPQPKMLRCQLKEYQVKGLNWLANLYEQGINGILADEMGLGKTVQSISVMAYLAETHNIWGPFLVIAPASTLHNWQQEITRFIPSFKALPYWGNGKDRKVLRKFWDRKQLRYTKDSPFHVLITSYQLVVADAQYFSKVKWQYMVLDEAQAIKSSSSARWKSLLSFHCRNRLLLTGTPIQNSMQELWALLHFIMPSLFDSHEEFSDWFSKDIESHATTNSQLNEQQLKRLHMILKPFMLRRVKRNVQQELGDKIEIDVYCNLTNRQRLLYRMLRSQINVIDLIERASSGSDEGTQSLMNLVMQFRKVCNHPDLFERADVKSAFNFANFGQTTLMGRDPPILDVQYTAQNAISLPIPKFLYRDGGFLDVPSENSSAGFRAKYVDNIFNVWTNAHIVSNSVYGTQAFAFGRFTGTSPSELSCMGKTGVFERALKNYVIGQQKSASIYDNVYNGEFTPKDKTLLISESKDISIKAKSSDVWKDLLSVGERLAHDSYYNVIERAYANTVECPPISPDCPDRSLIGEQQKILFDRNLRQALYPMTLNHEWSLIQRGVKPADFPASNLYPKVQNTRAGYSNMRLPSMARFVTDSGKLAKLDQLLAELKANDHRVLIYFQMTKMMDLLEEYLTFRQYRYVRLDGSSKLGDRRDLVHDWQTKPELFVFLLSTRAGGLGINLTAADTVIFYDSDWNPTIDSQAMDRAHRLGQTKQVTVYRLLVKGTIEERMRDRAKQKMHVQNVVMEGKEAAGVPPEGSVDFSKNGREVAFWLLDDDAAADAALHEKDIKDSEEIAKTSAAKNAKGGRKSITLEDMYHEDEGNFDESSMPSTGGTTTPVGGGLNGRRKGALGF